MVYLSADITHLSSNCLIATGAGVNPISFVVMVATYLHIIKRVSVGSFELPQIVANVAVFLLNETDDELEDFHGLPLSMRNGHSIDGAASPGTGSDLNEGMNAANICVKIYT